MQRERLASLSRRDVVAAMAATLTVGAPARGQGPGSAVSFVPGGRIGFERLAGIKPLSKSWHLLTSDQTLQVEVREALLINADWDSRLWEQDGRHALVASGAFSPTIQYRRFRDQRYGNDPNYGADRLVYRDDRWIGQITVSTSTLGSPVLAIPGGQIARWRPVIDALIASITVRGTPAVAEALAEFRMDLNVEGLNPRFVGDQLVLSLAPPRTPEQMSGIDGAYISIPELSLLGLSNPRAREQATNTAFDVYSRFAGSRIITGAPCRGVVLRENRLTDGWDPVFATTIMAFGRTRQLKLSAFYRAADRDRMLPALERLLGSLALPDGA